jgi:hypothetical protein
MYSPTRLSQRVVEAHATRWRRAFASRAKESSNLETYAQFDWHAFCGASTTASSGDEARSEYRRRQCPQEFFVLVGPVPHDGFSCRSETLPSMEGKGLDVYVVPQDFAWTMVFTHEAYLGPFFATNTTDGMTCAPGCKLPK